MSLKKHVRFQSLNLKENLSYKKSLNILWKEFMSSFGYKKYYDNSTNKNKDISYYENIIINDEACKSSIESFLDFLKDNSISIINNNLIVNNQINLDILSEAKIWIMFIIYISHNNNKKTGNHFDIVINIFKEAIKNGCDIISLFEFFLICLSEMNEKNFHEKFNIKYIEEIMPKEFIILYHKKKYLLRNIFPKNEENIFNNNYLINDEIQTHSTVFSSKKKENKKICLDINDIIVITKDYLNKGYFIIFQEKKNSKENILNSIINYDFEEDDEEYCLMPLLIKYQNYDQKLDANNTLNLINKSIYKNYTYYPHDINIINSLKL